MLTVLEYVLGGTVMVAFKTITTTAYVALLFVGVTSIMTGVAFLLAAAGMPMG